jgi:hypothetical protein
MSERYKLVLLIRKVDYDKYSSSIKLVNANLVQSSNVIQT